MLLYIKYTPLCQVFVLAGREVMNDMNTQQLNTALFIGIDAHPTTHTAYAMNRFEDEKGMLTFDNNAEGMSKFLFWIPTIEPLADNVIIGIEGGGNARHALLGHLLTTYRNLYEVNPLYTKQRRSFGTKKDKSDPRDAKLIAEVVTRKLDELPLITVHDLSSGMLIMRKTVWFYEQITDEGIAQQNQLHQLKREEELSLDPTERKVLAMMIQEREKSLAQVRKTQQNCGKTLDKLLTVQGKNLTTFHGVSTILAAKIVAHSGGIERFNNINDFIQYAGIAPREHSSGKTKRHKKAKLGNRHLNHAFYLVALQQIRHESAGKEYYEKKIKEGKTKKHALKCVMKRVACILYGMLKNGSDFQKKEKTDSLED
jgi:transposase